MIDCGNILNGELKMTIDNFETYRITAECIKNNLISQPQANQIFETDPIFLKWYLENYCNEPSFIEE